MTRFRTLLLVSLSFPLFALAGQTLKVQGYQLSADEIMAPKPDQKQSSPTVVTYFLGGNAAVKGEPTLECKDSITFLIDQMMLGVGACTATLSGKKFSGATLYLSKASGRWQIIQDSQAKKP